MTLNWIIDHNAIVTSLCTGTYKKSETRVAGADYFLREAPDHANGMSDETTLSTCPSRLLPGTLRWDTARPATPILSAHSAGASSAGVSRACHGGVGKADYRS